EVPAEPAEVGAGAGVHPAHPIDRDRPRHDRAGDQHDRRSAASDEVVHHPRLLLPFITYRRAVGRTLIAATRSDAFPGRCGSPFVNPLASDPTVDSTSAGAFDSDGGR